MLPVPAPGEVEGKIPPVPSAPGGTPPITPEGTPFPPVGCSVPDGNADDGDTPGPALLLHAPASDVSASAAAIIFTGGRMRLLPRGL
jgi:hypothetical protein